MRKTLIPSLALAALAASTIAPVALAGSVEVTFTHEATPFTDIGRSSHTQREALAALRQHFEALGKRLPDAQKLSIEVTDVDLAGEEHWTRHATDLRVLRGRADWPRIELKYTLTEGGRTLRQGSESIADMAYLFSSHGIAPDKPYAYERRMIDRWFVDTLTRTQVATR